MSEACALATRDHVCTRFMAELAAARRDHDVIPLTSVGYRALRLCRVATAPRPLKRPPPGADRESESSQEPAAADGCAADRARKGDAHLDLVGEDTLGGSCKAALRKIG